MSYIGLIFKSYEAGIRYIYSDLNNIIKRYPHEQNIIYNIYYIDYNVSYKMMKTALGWAFTQLHMIANMIGIFEPNSLRFLTWLPWPEDA